MEKFKTVTSKAVPIPIKDVDTDMIIPAQFMTSVDRDGYGINLFTRLKAADPNFPLNQSRYADAKIMITESNFACGSSREHAVWALTGAGFKVVIAKSFADIFYNNGAKNGLLLITLDEAVVDGFLKQAAEGGLELTVDLESQTVQNGDAKFQFTYDPFRKHCLLNGVDDLDYLLSKSEKIKQYREKTKSTDFYSPVIPQ